MKILRLKTLLKYGSKNRKNYSKYLKSLDKKEFEELYLFYSSLLIRKMFMYKDYKFLSKTWLKYKILDVYFYKIFKLFYNSNDQFIKEINEDIEHDNKCREKINSDLNEQISILQHISKKNVILNIDSSSTSNEIINFILILSENIYLVEEINRLMLELNNLDKK
jgi:hypothetical protein